MLTLTLLSVDTSPKTPPLLHPSFLCRYVGVDTIDIDFREKLFVFSNDCMWMQFLTDSLHSFQDPTTIEHQTAPSGDTYAVVDKPKRGFYRKRKPPLSEEVSYCLYFTQGTGI